MNYRIVWSSPLAAEVDIRLHPLASGTPHFEVWVDGEVKAWLISFAGAISNAEALVRKIVGEDTFYKSGWAHSSH